MVRLLLTRNDVDINAQNNEDKDTALYMACHRGFEDMVRILLDSPQINVNIGDVNGFTPLFVACHNGHEAVVSMLLGHDDIQVNKRNSYMCTPLMTACFWKRLGLVRILLMRDDVDVNAHDKQKFTALYYACSKGYEDVVRILLESPRMDLNKASNAFALHIALAKGHEAVVSILLGSPRLDVNIAALMACCAKGDIEIVKCPLDHKDIDINIENSDNKHECTNALALACRMDQIEIISMLLQRESLHKSSRNLGIMMQFVMQRRVNTKDIRAVLEKAISRNLPDIVVWLLKFDGSRNLGLRFYQDLLIKASEHRHLGVVQYLKDEKLVEAPNCDNPSTQGASALIPYENKDCDEEKSSIRDRGVCAKTSCTVPAVHRCRRCKKVAYCGTECQHEHWSVHQEDCKPPEKKKKKKKKREKENDGNQGQNSEVK